MADLIDRDDDGSRVVFKEPACLAEHLQQQRARLKHEGYPVSDMDLGDVLSFGNGNFPCNQLTIKRSRKQ